MFGCSELIFSAWSVVDLEFFEVQADQVQAEDSPGFPLIVNPYKNHFFTEKPFKT